MGRFGSNAASTDSLLRFFESAFFDEWICVLYLHRNTSPGVQEYLARRLSEFAEEGQEKYLLQLVYIAVNRPGGPLERALIDICSRSFRIAMKVRQPKAILGALALVPMLHSTAKLLCRRALAFLSDMHNCIELRCIGGRAVEAAYRWERRGVDIAVSATATALPACRCAGCCWRCTRSSPRIGSWRPSRTAARLRRCRVHGCVARRPVTSGGTAIAARLLRCCIGL